MSEDENWPVWLIVLVLALSLCLPCIAGLGFFFFYVTTDRKQPPGLPMQPVKRAGFAAVPVDEEIPPVFIP